MSQVVLLDSGPLGMVTNPKASSIEVQECKLWFNTLPQRNYTVMLPEITDYEVRRELLRVGKIKSIRRRFATEVTNSIPSTNNGNNAFSRSVMGRSKT